MDNKYENIVPWNGANDTGWDVRMKLKRNFSRIATNFLELVDKDVELEEWINEIIEELKNFLRKDRPDETHFLIKFFGGLYANYIQSINYSSGALGEGFLVKVDPKTGKSYIEVDELFVRMKAMFTALEIKKLSYAGGNFIFSSAGAKCVKVEEYDTFWRCYFLADDGITAIENDFCLDDQVRYGEFNIKPGVYEDVSNRFYWRLCVGIGENYIDLSKTDSEAPDNDFPKEGDSLVQLGNRTDKKRQNAIIVSVYGDDAPSIHQYAGIDSYSLAGKEVTVISPNGNKFTGDFFLKTGVNILTQFQILEDLIHSEISSVRDEIQAKDNYLYNSVFSSNTDGWQTYNKINFFTVNDRFLFLNDNFYASKKVVAIVTVGNRNVLRIVETGIRQLNADMQRKPVISDEYPNKFHTSFRYKVVYAGTLTIGFPDQSLYFSERLEPNEDFILKEYSGTWDGTGDFELNFSGGIYIHSLALTDNAYEDLITRFETQIEQTNDRITLLAKEVTNSIGSLESSISVTSENIGLINKRIDAVDGSIREMGIAINGITDNLSLYVKKDGLGSEINIALDNISVVSKKIYFTGDISANGNVSIQKDGTIKAIGGEFSGTISIADEKILLSADGSGKLADGKISWDKDGNLVISSQSVLEGFGQAGYMATAIKEQTSGDYVFYVDKRDLYYDAVLVQPVHADDVFALPGDSAVWQGRVLHVYNFSSDMSLKIMGSSKSIPSKGVAAFLGCESMSPVVMYWTLLGGMSGERFLGYTL